MADDAPPPGALESPWPPPSDDYQLLEMELEWNGLSDAQERMAAAMRLFVITRDPLAWIPNRGCAWATANADGDTLELVAYVLEDEVSQRRAAAGGDLAAALLPFAEPAVLAASASEALIVAGAYPDLAFRGQAPPLLKGAAATTSLPAPAVRIHSPDWEPIGLGAVQDLVQEAFGPVDLDRSTVRLAPAENPTAGCLACAGASFGFPGELADAVPRLCPAHRAEADDLTDQRIDRAHRSNPAGWRALGKGSARTTGLPDPPDTPMPPRHAVAVGRNDPCPCGSGRKYKQCCGR